MVFSYFSNIVYIFNDNGSDDSPIKLSCFFI
jgi:hypothetical protein